MTVLQQGPGIFCPRSNLHPPRSLPELPNQFSVKIETAIEVGEYETDTTTPHSPLGIPDNPSSGPASSTPERTGNCTIEAIPDWMGDAAKMQGRPLRLKLASELLQVDPSEFVYSGRRLVRGITADVWTAERIGETEADEYSTIELYFSTPEWKVQMDAMNELKNIPLGMTTYYADSRTAPYFHTKVESQYFEFSGSQPSWKQFDISHCLPSSQRLYLRLSLHVSYGQLVQFSLAVAQDSIRAALAKAGKVSPLRLLDLFLSSSRNKNGVDVWFVLLEKPASDENVEAAHKDSTSLTQAFKNMDKFFKKEGKLKLQLDRERNMVVGIIHDSFQVVGETSHPSFRNKSYHFLRTQYTAGSMAGLGFSMAVLGLSIGILVGFLLWKRRLGLPHFPHMHFPNSQMTPILSSPTTDLAQLTPAYPGCFGKMGINVPKWHSINKIQYLERQGKSHPK